MIYTLHVLINPGRNQGWTEVVRAANFFGSESLATFFVGAIPSLSQIFSFNPNDV